MTSAKFVEFDSHPLLFLNFMHCLSANFGYFCADVIKHPMDHGERAANIGISGETLAVTHFRGEIRGFARFE